jgi:hypothetical protein
MRPALVIPTDVVTKLLGWNIRKDTVEDVEARGQMRCRIGKVAALDGAMERHRTAADWFLPISILCGCQVVLWVGHWKERIT